MERLLRLLPADEVDRTPMTTHEFASDGMERTFEVSHKNEDDVVKVLIRFG